MLNIGWASRDVSTNEPVGIIGQRHQRISTGSHDPTTITVLVMEERNDSVIFISGDFTGINDGLLAEVKAAVGEKAPEVDCSKIIFNATHTHTAPRYHYTRAYDRAPQDRVHIAPPEKYRKFLVDSVSDAVAEAYQNRAEGSFSFGYGSAAVGMQRRVVYFNDKGAANTATDTFAVNGHGKMYGETDQDDFSGFEGAVDTNVNLLYTFDHAGKLTGAIINVPCPSQCTEQQFFTSADYWHETRELIRKKHGDIYILPQCAAAGDLSPHLLLGAAAFMRKNRLKYGEPEDMKNFMRPVKYYMRLVIAEKIAHAFDECLEWASREKITEAPITHITKTVPLDAWKVTEKEYEAAKESFAALSKLPFAKTDDPLGDYKNNTAISCNLSRSEKVIDRYEKGVEYVNTEIHILKLGEIAFTTCPFELYLDYQHRIQARSPFIQTFMVQLAASDTDATEYGYLPTEKGAANKGYSAIMFSCNVSPEGGQTLVEETLKELHRIK